ncbi:hypothetical protein RQP46_007970 [Phenoliferia psychrophenolica]
MNDLSAPSTTLLSLPTEILSQIASDLAPNGGAFAGPLRLVCRALNAVATRTVMSSLHCISDSKPGGELLAAILSGEALLACTSFRLDLDGLAGANAAILAVAVAAIRKLRHINHLHLVGNLDKSGVDELPAGLMMAIPSFSPTLTTLSIEEFDMSEARDPHIWAPHVRNLSLTRCDGWYGFVGEATPSIAPPLAKLELDGFFSDTNGDEVEASDTMSLLAWAAPHVESISLSWRHAGPSEEDYLVHEKEYHDDDDNIWINSPLQRFRLHGLKDLWNQHDEQSAAVLRLLSTLGKTKLRELTLPISLGSDVINVFKDLVMPGITTLCLESAFPQARLDLNTFALLESLLPGTFPNVKILQLHDWDDPSPREVSSLAPDLRARKYPLVCSLLVFLASTTVTRVHLRGIFGGEGQFEARFVRDEDGVEWSSEVFQLFLH